MIKLASLLVLTIGLASANTITWTTPAGSTSAGGLVDASATVVTSTGSVTVTLNDLLGNPHNVGQLLSDFFFTLSSTPTTALSTTTTPTEPLNLIDIASNGSVTSNPGSFATWGLTSSGAIVHLDSLTGGGTQTIIGPSGPGGVYTNANSSITGNSGHNPFINGTATFTFLVGGVTTNTTVTAATFSFGTAAGDNVLGTTCITNCGGTQQDIPEPLSMFLMGGGLLGVGIFGKFRRA